MRDRFGGAPGFVDLRKRAAMIPPPFARFREHLGKDSGVTFTETAMGLKKTIEAVVRLAEQKAVGNYAIAGAVAALNYIQPTFTEDLDILISIDGFEKRTSGLLLLGPIEKALADMGYTERTDVGYLIEDWPVQFLPVASPLDEEALEQAVELDVDEGAAPPIKARVLRAEHLAAIALKVGRLKDLARIDAFLEQDVLDFNRLKSILERHRLMAAWRAFCLKAGRKDLFAGGSS